MAMTDLKISKLSNGLRVITDIVPSVESVAVGVWIGSGTRDEDIRFNGAAHMVEHMMFKGTKKRNAYEIAVVIENVGGNMNAYTSREMTSYHIHLLKEDLNLAMDVLADIVQHSTMPADEVEREREVILQEIGMCHDTPDDLIFDNYYEAAYPKQAIGAPILGTVETIKAMSRDSLMGFVNKNYTPANMVLCAAGNIDHDSLLARAEILFADLPKDQKNKEARPRYESGESRVEKELEQSHVVLGFQGVSRLDDSYYAAQALSTLLGGGMSSRLFQEVREKRGLVYSIFSFHSAYIDDGQFGIYAGTGPDKLQELMPVVCDEILAIAKNLSESEIERAKAQLRANTLMARESMMSRADQSAKSMLMRGMVRSPEEIIRSINAVDKSTIEKVSSRIFASKPTLAALGPLDTLEDFDAIKRRLAA